MTVKTFSQWLEAFDIFGFEKELFAEPKNVYDEKPVKGFSYQRLMDNLVKYPIGSKQPKVKHINEICWGEGPGALRLRIGTGLNCQFERMNVDLQGINRWITKKVYQIPQQGYGGHEDAIAQEAISLLKIINEGITILGFIDWLSEPNNSIELTSEVNFVSWECSKCKRTNNGGNKKCVQCGKKRSEI